MSELDTFDLLSLQLDPQSKAVQPTGKAGRQLGSELERLNALHRAVVGIPSDESNHGVPRPPIPVTPKRSAAITKLRDQGNTEFRKQKYADAIRVYSLGIEMAVTRPMWEPAALVKEEISGLFANRAQAHMALQNWPEGAVDAEASVEARRVGNPKGWWRRGKCLLEMGRLEESRDWVRQGLEVEGEEADLASLLKEIEAKIDREQQ